MSGTECTWEGGDGGVHMPPQIDGPIVTTWDGDQILWEYAAAEVSR